MSLDTRGVQIANGSKNLDDEHFVTVNAIKGAVSNRDRSKVATSFAALWFTFNLPLTVDNVHDYACDNITNYFQQT